jgi:hypothetical protein
MGASAPNLLMPKVANSALDVASNALFLMGADSISSFTANTPEAKVANALYEDIVQSSFASHRWRFAARQQTLVRLDGEPTGRFDASYHIPSSCVTVVAVTVNDHPIKYDIYQNKILCDEAESATLVLDYIDRASESDWPSYFTTAVEFLLAGTFAVTLARDASLAQLMDAKAQELFVKARNIDSQQQTTRKLNTSRFIAQRRS